jgi:flagellin
MGLRLNTNMVSLHAQRSLAQVTRQLEGNYRRLASGLRIAQAQDDAAGLSIAERFRSQIRSTQQAMRNAQDGVSLTQTAEGGLIEVSSMLLRMRELAIQSNQGSTSGSDRETLDQEFQQLVAEIDRIARSTTFNGVRLLDGTGSTITFQIGIGDTVGLDTITLSTADTLASSLGLSTLDIGSGGSPTLAIRRLDAAIDEVSRIRGHLGAVQNRLTSTVQNLRIQDESLSASHSRIRDADLAVEVADQTRFSILQQAGIAVLGQANAQPQAALQLLRF